MITKPGMRTVTNTGRRSNRLFSYLPFGHLAKEPTRIGLWGKFWVGTQLGLLWTPCAGPVLGGILVLAAVNHQAFSAFGLLVSYSVGAAMPLLAIAYGGRTVSHRCAPTVPRCSELVA